MIRVTRGEIILEKREEERRRGKMLGEEVEKRKNARRRGKMLNLGGETRR